MSRSSRSPLALAILLGLFFGCLYLLTGSSDLLNNGDTDLRYQTAQAIVDFHRLWIAKPMWTDARVRPGAGGHLYAFYAPGQAIMMVPLYVAGKFLAHHLSLPYDITTLYAARSLDLFLGAALSVVFFLFALSAGYSARVAVILTLIFGTASVVWPDAQSALEQTPVDLFLLLAVLGFWRFASSHAGRRPWLLLTGAGAGCALLTRYDAGLFLPVLALCIAAVRLRRREPGAILPDLAVYAAPVAPCLVALGAWDVARFGSPFLTGLNEQTLGNPVWLGVPDLLVSPGKGLVWYLPLVFLLPWAAARFYRRSPGLAVLCAVLVVTPLLFYANVLYWHGDPAWGPRYLYVAVPYLVLPLGELLSAWERNARSLKAAFVVVVAASVLLQVCAVAVTPWRYWTRLERLQQLTVRESTWSGQPFRWGSQHYHYYWNLRQSPILLQVDDVYQVALITAGNRTYLLQGQPDPYVSSNTSALYPVNTFAFWWLDRLHPILGARTRDALAALLAAGALAALAVLLVALGREPVALSLGLVEAPIPGGRVVRG